MLKRKFKLLDRIIPNTQLHSIGTEFRIAAALHNMFSPRLLSDHDDYSKIVFEMKRLKTTENEIQKLVIERNLNRKKASFKAMDSDADINFPPLSDSQLKLITLGSYQLKQATSYLVEHFSDDSPRKFEVIPDQIDGKRILRGKMNSKHCNSKIYLIYIAHTDTDVTGWYCTCHFGARTVGCCSHIAALLMYFGGGRRIPRNVNRLNHYMSSFNRFEPEALLNGDDNDSDAPSTSEDE